MAESLVVVEEETVDTPMSQKDPQSQSVEIDSSVEDELHSSVHVRTSLIIIAPLSIIEAKGVY